MVEGLVYGIIYVVLAQIFNTKHMLYFVVHSFHHLVERL